MPLSLFERLPAEIHEKIFDHVVVPSESSHAFQPSSLLVSTTYYNGALRSYYQHGDITISGTQAGRKHLHSIPKDLKKLITSMTLTGGALQVAVLEEIKRDCPRLVNLTLKKLSPLGYQISFLWETCWLLTSHIPNVTIIDTPFHMNEFLNIKRVLREHPTWNMEHWGRICRELGVWKGILGTDPMRKWLVYLRVLKTMYPYDGSLEHQSKFVDLVSFENIASRWASIWKVRLRASRPGAYNTEESLIPFRLRAGKLLCGPNGILSIHGGVWVDGQWEF